MTLNVINGPIIAAGESFSDAVDCSGGDAVRITMPAEWTGANLTFAISTDGNGFNDLFDLEGNEITIVVKPGAAVRMGREWASFWNFIKFRSGTRDHPVVQRERREFAITLSTAAAAAPAARSADAPGPGGAIGVSCPGAAGAPGIEGTISNKRR
jgi:hypothetical protein